MGKAVLSSKYNPDSECYDRYQDYSRNKECCYSVCNLLYWGFTSLSLSHHFDNLRKKSVTPYFDSLESKTSLLVYCSSINWGCYLLSCCYWLSCYHTLINERVSIHNHSVHWNSLAWAHKDNVANTDLFDCNHYVFSVSCNSRSFWLKTHQFFNCSCCVSFCSLFQCLPK